MVMAGCGPVAPDRMKRQVPIHPRILSMNPCIDAILLRVADPGQIVSISHLSQEAGASSVDMAHARRFPANRGTAEEVIAARPDIVLLEPHAPAATQAAIRRLGIRIEPVAVPETIAQSLAQVRAIGRIAAHAERGEALAARIDAALAAARPPAGAPPVPALIRMADGLVPGPGTLADDLLARAGFRNLSPDYGLANWDVLPLEPLLARPPRILFADAMRRAARPELLDRMRGTRRVDFPDRLLQCAGPNLIEAAGRMAAARRKALAS
jgi:iron complex transport system substrate-binding protein